MSVRALFLILVAGCGSQPLCGEVTLDDLQVDSSSEAPVFSWEGRAESLVVHQEGEVAWELRCRCLAEDKRPDTNAGCQETMTEFEFRHCLQGPVTYGETPSVATLQEPDDFDGVPQNGAAEALVSGETYEVSLSAACDGDGEANTLEQIVSFVAP